MQFEFTDIERKEITEVLDILRVQTVGMLQPEDEHKIHAFIRNALDNNNVQRDIFGLNPILCALQTCVIAVQEIGLKRDSVIAILLYRSVLEGYNTIEDIHQHYGDGVAHIIQGIVKVQSLYAKTPTIETENFRNLLLTFAEDMRVILIMIADRVNLMRQLKDCPNHEAVMKASEEASYLYAPLAHKLGLYKLKSELEDLSLKYLEHDAYYHIKEKLNATKTARDAYIKQFIVPIKERLETQGLKFHIKGRTKSIHSIWQKMKKQQCPFEGVYDLFAIRIILDSEAEKEKQQCWQVYSIITDMYQPNPKRLRDWLSVPKSNGYESLHITVLGPPTENTSSPTRGGQAGSWVEVQIRTERMDDIAEHGLAAHWRYKGVKATDGGLDDWLANIRSLLEDNTLSSGEGRGEALMDQFKTSTMVEKEVYVFTPRGDIFKFPNGATVLDFAYHIHSRIGNQCTGGKINGKVVNMRQKLASGDTVEVITSSQQKPKQDWLHIAYTSRAKSKIRLALKETVVKEIAITKEMIERRIKNRKLDYDDGVMQSLIKKMGFKVVSEFYQKIADGTVDVADIIERYQELKAPKSTLNTSHSTLHTSHSTLHTPHTSASDFKLQDDKATLRDQQKRTEGDVLELFSSHSGEVSSGRRGAFAYSMAPCCRPIYGDDVFGFVTINGGIKIHRKDCPNAPELHRRFGYRIVEARWSGKGSSQYSTTIRVIGNDDIGIVSNITNIISKEEHIMMRSINIDTNDGLFAGTLVIQIDDTGRLEQLLKKLRTVKGVRQVTRL